MIPNIEGLRLIVCGGRDYYDRNRVFATLDRIRGQKPIGLIVHGACCDKGDKTLLRGADRWAQEWAQENEVPYLGVPAKWTELGTGAGPARNGVMAQMGVNGLVAFPGRNGTANMVTQAEAAGLKVWNLKEAKIPTNHAVTPL